MSAQSIQGQEAYNYLKQVQADKRRLIKEYKQKLKLKNLKKKKHERDSNN